MRLSFKQYMEEAVNVGTGDCYETAGKLILAMGGHFPPPSYWSKVKTIIGLKETPESKDFRMVHALVRGQGRLSGKRFGHGWVEWKQSLVIDFSNGNELVLPKSVYYSAGKVDPNEKGAYVTYTTQEAKVKILGKGHWGPWDLNEDLEEKFDIISKKRVKIDPEVRKALQ